MATLLSEYLTQSCSLSSEVMRPGQKFRSQPLLKLSKQKARALPMHLLTNLGVRQNVNPLKNGGLRTTDKNIIAVLKEGILGLKVLNIFKGAQVCTSRIITGLLKIKCIQWKLKKSSVFKPASF